MAAQESRWQNHCFSFGLMLESNSDQGTNLLLYVTQLTVKWVGLTEPGLLGKINCHLVSHKLDHMNQCLEKHVQGHKKKNIQKDQKKATLEPGLIENNTPLYTVTCDTISFQATRNTLWMKNLSFIYSIKPSQSSLFLPFSHLSPSVRFHQAGWISKVDRWKVRQRGERRMQG